MSGHAFVDPHSTLDIKPLWITINIITGHSNKSPRWRLQVRWTRFQVPGAIDSAIISQHRGVPPAEKVCRSADMLRDYTTACTCSATLLSASTRRRGFECRVILRFRTIQTKMQTSSNAVNKVGVASLTIN